MAGPVPGPGPDPGAKLARLTDVFLASFPAGPWQANCYLAAARTGGECLIVDPGMDALSGVRQLVDEHALRPAGILLTHGHFDHVATATELAGEFGVPCWIHPDDRELLTDPAAGLGADLAALAEQWFGGTPPVEPDDLRLLDDGDVVEAAGLALRVIHAPGHRPGCVMFALDYPGHPEIESVVFSGDVLFAGSIGRTDLPGGDHHVMLDTLRGPVLGLSDATAVLPGHGPQTVMARERATNPYLQPDYLRTR